MKTLALCSVLSLGIAQSLTLGEAPFRAVPGSLSVTVTFHGGSTTTYDNVSLVAVSGAGTLVIWFRVAGQLRRETWPSGTYSSYTETYQADGWEDSAKWG